MTNVFEQEIGRSLRHMYETHDNFYYHRLYDTNTFRGVSENMFAIRQPADYMAIYHGRPVFIECKSSHSPTSYSFDYIKPHQLETLLYLTECGADAWFLINNRSNRRNIQTYALTAEAVYTLLNKTLAEGKKSIKWEDIVYEGEQPLLTKTEYGWNLDEIVD